MSEIYAFCFCLGLGIVTRLIFVALSTVAKRTNLFPVTVVLDMLCFLSAGGTFIAYVILSGAVLAPYMFAATCGGYLFCYYFTRSKKDKGE